MSQDLALPAPSPSALRWRRVALPALFFLLGVHYATWAARLPAIRDALSLDAATLGTVLLGGGIGSVCSFPLAASLVGQFGARRAALMAGLVLVAVLPVLPWIPDWRGLMLGLVVTGAMASTFDVAINALGASAEREAGRPIMSMLHAWFCVGTFAGALLGSLAAANGMRPWAHFLATGGGLAALLVVAYRCLPCDRPEVGVSERHFALPHGALVWVGLIAFFGAISEGSLTNWIPLYLRDQLRASEAVAPLGYAAFAAAMLLARSLGDRLKARLGARRLVVSSSLLAAVGIALAVSATSVPMALPGFVLAGLGVAAVFPCVFSAAGREGPTALAGVATLGYGGSLMGPPIMGYMVHGFGLRMGLGFLALVSVGVCLAAGRARLLR